MSPRRPDATVAPSSPTPPRSAQLCARRGVPAADLPDMEQEVVLRAWLQLRGEGHDDALASLLWVIAWRTGRNWTQRRATREWSRAEPLEEAEHEGADPIDRLEARDRLRVLARLDPRERRLIEGLADGDTLAKMAKRHRVPLGTVGTRIRKLRRDLRRK